MKKNISFIDLKLFIHSKLFLGIFLIVPQLFLFAVNANSFFASLKSEFSGLNYRIIIASFVLQAFTFICSSVIINESVSKKKRKEYVSIVLNLLLLISACAFMAFYYFIIYRKIGRVSSKLIIEEHLLYLQFACMASSVIYPLLCASMWRMEKSSVKEIVIISLSGIIFPLSWFAFFGIFSAVYGSIMYSSSKVIAISFIAVFCACCLFSIIALVRLFSFVVIKTEKYKLQRNLLIGIVSGFILPFSGLVLNIIIPFPGNFQYPGIYLLTFINALVVIIPETKNRLCNICITAVRIILIPFIVYFFVILAPAFPFAFLLILLFGTGLIPLSPVFLLIIHISKLRKDYFQYYPVFGKLKTLIIITALLSVLPLVFSAKKYIEYKVMQNASEYVLNEKSSEELKYPLFMVKESLLNFYRDKTGLGLPVLSAMSVQISDKTLPQNRLDEMFEVYIGDSAFNTIDRMKGFRDFAVFGNKTYNARDSLILTKEKIISDASIESVEEIAFSDEGNSERHSVKISMKEVTGQQRNQGFRGKIRIPDGVFISGLKLKIGDQFEDGRIFEKTSSIWVYKEIKRRAQDPAVIYYLSDNELRFEVFPFKENEKRECIIEFVCPEGSFPKIKFQCQLLISDSCMEIAENIILNSKSEAKILKKENASGSVFYIPESIAKNMKTENRKPVLYIIADISKDSTISKHDIISTAAYVKQNNPEIDSASVCYTNYLPNEGEVLSIEKLIDKLDVAEIEEFVSKKGGFFYKKAIQKISAEYEVSEKEFPVFAIVTSSTEKIMAEKESISGMLPPDADGFYLTSDGQNFSFQPEKKRKGIRRLYFGNGESSVFHGDDSILYFAEKNSSDYISFTDTRGNARKLYPENAAGTIKTAFDLYSEDKIKSKSDGTIFNGLIQSSRNSGIMISSTSYIVVENESQWKELEDKEKEILDNEYIKTYNSPEPESFIILSVFVILLALMKHKRRRYSC